MPAIGEATLIALAIVFAAVLFAGGIVVLGFGALIFANAAKAVVVVRSHTLTTNDQAAVTDSANAALQDIAAQSNRFAEPPDDEDLAASIRLEREYDNPPEFTTNANEEVEDEGIVDHGQYVPREIE